MDDVMNRFLSSIGLKEEIDSFDLKFTKLHRNPTNRKQMIMEMTKSIPWDYRLLVSFQNGLMSINYPYDLTFRYEQIPTATDAESLFKDWHLDHVASECEFETKVDDACTLVFVFSSEEQKKKQAKNIREFQNLLDWLGYHVTLSSEVVVPEVETEVVSEAELQAQAQEALKETYTEIQEESAMPSFMDEPEEESLASLSNEEVQAHIQKEFDKNQQAGEEVLMEQLLANQKAMEEERNRKRVFSIGDYTIIEKLEEIENVGLVNVDFTGEIFQTDSRIAKSGKRIVTF